MAMREDEIAAASQGIDLVRTKLLAFGLGASFSGFAGSLFASMLQFIDPAQFRFDISIMELSMIILGGLGNVYGVIGGGLLFGIFNFIFVDRVTAWLKSVSEVTHVPFLAIDLSDKKLFIFGLLLVVMMLWKPEGLFPAAERAAEFHPDDNEDLSSTEPGEMLSEKEIERTGERI
jgi:branched-chain amino acid transport system permease protein